MKEEPIASTPARVELAGAPSVETLSNFSNTGWLAPGLGASRPLVRDMQSVIPDQWFHHFCPVLPPRGVTHTQQGCGPLHKVQGKVQEAGRAVLRHLVPERSGV